MVNRRRWLIDPYHRALLETEGHARGDTSKLALRSCRWRDASRRIPDHYLGTGARPDGDGVSPSRDKRSFCGHSVNTSTQRRLWSLALYLHESSSTRFVRIERRTRGALRFFRTALLTMTALGRFLPPRISPRTIRADATVSGRSRIRYYSQRLLWERLRA